MGVSPLFGRGFNAEINAKRRTSAVGSAIAIGSSTRRLKDFSKLKLAADHKVFSVAG